jgi:trans-L-3-hydroxyproline dehydratase
MQISTIDYHTGGEPLRIVRDGLPEVPGETMLAKRRYMQSEMDHLRRFLIMEPRGHTDMYGAVLTEAVTADGDVGVLFMHNAGFSTMCGHGIIALVTAGLERDLFPIRNPQDIRIDTPAGRVTARANRDEKGDVESVSFLNVPSFVLEDRRLIEFEGGQLEVTTAFGGAFYAYVDADAFGLELQAAESGRLVDIGQRIKHEVGRQLTIAHPSGDKDLGFLYGTIFVKQGEQPGYSRNVCVFADGELDRSPTGTGVSGRAAIDFARGEIGLGDELKIESIIGTSFRVRCVQKVKVGDVQAIIPEVSGSAHISGEHRFILGRGDPLPEGFFIP